MKQLTRIFFLIIFVFTIFQQVLLGQQTTSTGEKCAEELFPYYKAFVEERTSLDEKYRKAKLFLEKSNQPGCESWDDFGDLGVRKFIKRYELNRIREKCVAADKAYYSKPDLANLNAMITACNLWIEKAPTPDHYFPTRLGIATGFGLLAGFYKDVGQTYSFTEKALESLKQEKVPPDWKESDWLQYRRDNIARLLQYRGLCKLRQAQADTENAKESLTLAAAMKTSQAYRDSNTYLLRAEANIASCPKINEVLAAKNKKIKPLVKSLKEICPVVEEVIQDYARVVALSNLVPIVKIQNDDTQEVLTRLWNFTYPNSSRKKLNDLLQFYEAEFRKK